MPTEPSLINKVYNHFLIWLKGSTGNRIDYTQGLSKPSFDTSYQSLQSCSSCYTVRDLEFKQASNWKAFYICYFQINFGIWWHENLECKHTTEFKYHKHWMNDLQLLCIRHVIRRTKSYTKTWQTVHWWLEEKIQSWNPFVSKIWHPTHINFSLWSLITQLGALLVTRLLNISSHQATKYFKSAQTVVKICINHSW